MLGGAITKAAASVDRFALFAPASSVDWQSEQVTSQLDAQAESFGAFAASHDRWAIVWAAGAGMVGASEEVLAQETSVFRSFLESVPALQGEGVVLFSSSAGTVHGQTDVQIDEHTPLAPVSPYGKAKVAQEELFRAWSATHSHVHVGIARISNLYGSQQKLSKPQGLLSHLCRSALLRQPLHIYVPLDTRRDYLSADDCAVRMLAFVESLFLGDASTPLVKVFASQHSVSIAEILGMFGRIAGIRPRIVTSSHASSEQHVRSVRFRSRVLPEIDALPLTPLDHGLHRLLLAMLGRPL